MSLWVSCHCEDVARAFVEAVGNPQAFGKSYTVAGEEWMTWNDIHRIVAEEIGAPEPALVHIPTDLLAQMTRRAFICAINFQYNNIFDNAAARADLNFRYTIPFREGVRRIVAWLDTHHRIENSDNDPEEDRVLALWQRHTESLLKESGASAPE